MYDGEQKTTEERLTDGFRMATGEDESTTHDTYAVDASLLALELDLEEAHLFIGSLMESPVTI